MLLCWLICNSVTSSRARIETSIPRKHGPAIAGYESVCSFFFYPSHQSLENEVMIVLNMASLFHFLFSSTAGFEKVF